MNRQKALTIVGILAVLGLGLWAYSLWFAPAQVVVHEEAGSISNFFVEKPNLVVTGRNLAKVEIWAEPAASYEEQEELLIGTARLSSFPGNDETWELLIPREPIPVIKVVAKAFNSAGAEIGTATLPAQGEADLFDALWGIVDEETMVLKVGDTFDWNGLSFVVQKIAGDSRCAQGVTCVTAGEVVVEVAAKAVGSSETLSISSAGNPKSFAGYFIELKTVTPPKTLAEIKQDDYRLMFTVSRDAKL